MVIIIRNICFHYLFCESFSISCISKYSSTYARKINATFLTLDRWKKIALELAKYGIRCIFGTIKSFEIVDAKSVGRERGNMCQNNFPGNIPRNLWVINFMNPRLSSRLTGRTCPSLCNISIMTDCGRSSVCACRTLRYYRLAGF